MARTSPVHYIAPSAISITPNANGLASDLAVYIEPGTKIRVFEPTIAALGMQDSNFQEWTLEGRNRRLNDATKPYTIYARLNKSNTADGYLVFAPQVQDENEEWQDPYVLSPNTSASSAMTETVGGKAYTWDALPAKQAQGGRSGYWWVKLGTISAPVSSARAITLDTGILGTDGYNADWALNPVLYPSRVVTVDRGLWSATPQAVFSAEGFDHAEWTPDGKLATVNGRSYGTLVASYGEQGVKQVVSTGDTISEPYHFKTMSKATWLNRRLSTPQTGADGVNDGLLEARCLTEFMEDLEISRVWHYGCLWECLTDGTAEEPGYGCTDWQVISGDTSFHLYITGENGATLGDTLTVNRGSVNETLRGSLFRGQEDVSAKVSAWSWDIIEAGGQVISGTSSQRQLVVTDGSLPASWTAQGFVTLRLNAVLDGVTFTVYLKIVNTDISSYEVEFSGYVDVITVDDVGNCIGGLYTVSSDSSSSDDGETYRDYRIHSAISVRRNGALLICEDSNLSPDSSDSSSSSSSDDDVPAGAGRYKIYAEPHGCTCVIENSTIYITSIDNIKDGVAGSQDDVNFDYDAMRQMEQCSVDLLIDCEGIATIQKNFPVTIKHDSQPFVGADISNEHSAVSWITRTRQYIGLPVVMDFKMWHNNEVLDVSTLSLASATTGVSLVEGTAPSTLASKTIYYTKSRITAYRSGVSYKFYHIELTAMSPDIPLVVDIDVTGTALYSGVSYERTLRHTVSKSTDTNVYSLIPSTDEVIVAKTGVLSTNTITCRVMCDSSDDTHYIVDPANYSTHKLVIYYKKFYTDGTEDANETAYTSGGVGVTSAVREVVFYLYGTTNGAVDRTIFHDSEGVPVIANGTDGNGVEYIFMQRESWNGNDNDKPTIYDDSQDNTVVSGSTTRADLFQMDDHCPYDTAAHYGNQEYQWTDEPQGVAANLRFEFYAQRKFKNGRWQPFGEVLLWNHYATSGETMYVIDLTNENSFVNCDEDGTPLTGANYETSEVMIFFGLQSVLSDFNLKANPVNISCNGYYPRGGTAVSGQQETPQGGFDLSSPYILTPSNITANAATITVTATHKTDNSIVLVATYKINKNIAGKTGLIYSLQPSLNVIKKSASGTFVDQTLGIEVKKTRGVDSTLLTTPKQIADEGLTLLYDNASGSNNSLVAAGATSTSPVTIATNTFVGSGTYGKLVLKKGITVHDTERINCVMDGKSQPFYIYAEEAWNDSNSSHPAESSSAWSPTTPTKNGKYLWRRTRKMVLNSGGTAYEPASGSEGAWSYQLLSGTDGTSINPKGTVAAIVAYNTSLPTAGMTSGDLGIKQGDNSLYTFNGTSWVSSGTTVSDGDSYKVDKDCQYNEGNGVVNVNGHLFVWSDEAHTADSTKGWIPLGQFKGEDGANVHIAWADDITITNGVVTAAPGFTIGVGSNGDGKSWMGVCIDKNAADPTTFASYTWRYVKGVRGEDAADREWIYKLTNSSTPPSIPSPQNGDMGTVNGVATAYSNTQDDWVPDGWSDNPQSVDPNNKFEYACYRDKARGATTWGPFVGVQGDPILWSHYGERGTDGDGVEYVFVRTKDNVVPQVYGSDSGYTDSGSRAYTADDHLPRVYVGSSYEISGTGSVTTADGKNIVECTDDPVGTTSYWKFEWVLKRTKGAASNGVRPWNAYSGPMSLWANWSQDGISVESYIETQEAWSNDVETSSAYTSPATRANAAAGAAGSAGNPVDADWSPSTPDNTNNYMYLWRRSRKMVLNAAGTAYEAEQSGGVLTDDGKWKYLRLNGAAGTSIKPKGDVVYVASSYNGLPASGTANTYAIVASDPQLYVYDDNDGWSQVGTDSSDGDCYVVTEDCTYNGENVKGYIFAWSDEREAWISLGQFKGEKGVTYYMHIAWTDKVDAQHPWVGDLPAGQTSTPTVSAAEYVGTHTVGNTTEVHFSVSPQDGYDYMGLCINTSETDPPSSQRHYYTWKYAKGEPGVDSADREWIYRRSDSATPPALPTNSDSGKVNGVTTAYSNTQDGWIPDNWFDHPQGVDPDHKYEYACYRDKARGEHTWGAFKGRLGTGLTGDTPMLWSHYGQRGTDGDGVEYVFVRTKEKVAPEVPDSGTYSEDYQGYDSDDHLPYVRIDKNKAIKGYQNGEGTTSGNYKYVKCTDDPVGTESDWPYEWVLKRTKGNASNGVRSWNAYSGSMSLWANWSEDGQDSATLLFTPAVLFFAGNENRQVTDTQTLSVVIAMLHNGAVCTVDTSAGSSAISIDSNPSGVSITRTGLTLSITNTSSNNANLEGAIKITITGTHNGKTYTASGSIPIAVNPQGETGNGIQSITTTYAVSAYGVSYNGYETNPPQDLNPYDSDDWSASSPAVTSGKPFLWRREYTLFTGGSSTTKYYCVGRIGEDGIDGDGVEYVFIRTTDNTPPTIGSNGNDTWTETVNGATITHRVTDDDFRPMTSAGRATDEPQGTTYFYKFEWVAQRTKVLQADGKSRIWGNYPTGAMRLWANWSKDGVSMQSYNETQEAWSNDKETTNAFTSPATRPSAIAGADGSAGHPVDADWSVSTPANSNNLLYLWRRSRKMVLNAAGTAYEAEQSGGQLTDSGKWKYQRLSGTNGTNIDVKGNVATTSQLGDGYVYPFVNGATSQTQVSVSDGQTYVCNADGHLYQWSDELRTKSGSWTDYTSGWLDLGQFKGDKGTDYYTHIAWTDKVILGTYTGPVPDGQTTTPNAAGSTEAAAKANVGTHIINNQTVVHFSESPQEDYDWMGVLINTDSGSLDSSNRHLYTWKYVKGADGTSPWLAYIDNEMDSIRTTDAGVPTSSQSVQTVPSLYHGATAQTPAITGVKRNGTNMTVVTAGSQWSTTGITVTFNNGVITITYATTASISGGKDEFTITIGDSQGTVSFDRIMTVLATSGDIYNLKPSVSQIKVGRDGSGNYSPSAATISCGYVKKNIEGGITSVDDASSQIDGTYNIYFRLRTRSNQTWATGYERYGEGGNHTMITSTGFNVAQKDAVQFILCKNTGDTIASDAYIQGLIDRQTVSVVADGEDGNGIASVTTTYGRSSYGESANDSTAPSGLDTSVGTNGWAAGSPEATANYPFLWRREYTLFTNGTSTTKYYCIGKLGDRGIDGPGSEWVYIRTTSNTPPVLLNDANYSDSHQTPRDYDEDDFLPRVDTSQRTDIEGWDNPNFPGECSDDPRGVSKLWPYEWEAKRMKLLNQAGTAREWQKYYDAMPNHEMTLCNRWSEDAVTYWIEINSPVFHRDPTTDSITPSVLKVIVHRVEGGTDTALTWAALNTTYGLTLQFNDNNGMGWSNINSSQYAELAGNGTDADSWLTDITTEEWRVTKNGDVLATAGISVIENGEAGDTGPMFYLAGVYDDLTEYTRTKDLCPVVFYDGSYYYLKKNSQGNLPSNTTYWGLASRFKMIMTEALFADFAKFGYMFSMNGYVNGVAKNNGAMMGTTPAYTRFMGDPTKLGGTFTRSYITDSPYSGSKDTLAAKVVQKGVTISVTVTGKATTGTLYVEILDSSGSRLKYMSFGSTEQTQTISYESPADGTYYIKAYCDAGNRTASLSGTYSFSGYFEPNWWVDLKTGKMVAAKGNFVVDANGDVHVKSGDVDVKGTVKATNLFRTLTLTSGNGAGNQGEFGGANNDTPCNIRSVTLNPDGSQATWIYFRQAATVNGVTFQQGKYYTSAEVEAANDINSYYALDWKNDPDKCSVCTGPADEVMLIDNFTAPLQVGGVVLLPRCEDFAGKTVVVRHTTSNGNNSVNIYQCDYASNKFYGTGQMNGWAYYEASQSEAYFSIEKGQAVTFYSTGTKWLVVAKS